MNKFLLATGLFTIAASTAMAAGPVHFAKHRKAPSKFETKAREVMKINKANEQGIWQPGTITYFYFDGAWVEDYAQTLIYYPNGTVKEMTQDGTIVRYFYDELGRIVKLSGAAESNPNKDLITYVFGYDSVVKDALIRIDVTVSQYGMSLTESQIMDVIRNAAGNITDTDTYILNVNGDRQPIQKTKVEYDANNVANKITVTQYEDEYDPYITTFSDIVWENTNGQIFGLSQGANEYELSFFMGDNRMKSAVNTDNEEPYPSYVNAVYTDNGYELAISVTDITTEKMTYTKTDQYGSYVASILEADYDYNPSTGALDYDGSTTITQTYTVDAYGLVLEDTKTEMEDEDPVSEYELESTIGHVAYDQDYGYPLEYWSVEIENGYSHEKEMRQFSDYELYTGVKKVDSENAADAKTEYFNLQGVKVENPSQGIFIRRTGAKTEKVVF